MTDFHTWQGSESSIKEDAPLGAPLPPPKLSGYAGATSARVTLQNAISAIAVSKDSSRILATSKVGA